MNEKLVINISAIIQAMESNYNGVYHKIRESENPSELKSDIDGFFDSMTDSITSFFYLDNAGCACKQLYTLNENTVVKAMDFEYARKQYFEYLEGMRRYVEEAKTKDIDNSEITQTINDIITKDEDFIKSLCIIGENIHNPEKETELCNALKCLEVLCQMKYTIEDFKRESCCDGLFDKLYLLSKVNFVHHASLGMMTQVERIVKEINGETEVPEEPAIKYAVY